jgi:hypothetical protein
LLEGAGPADDGRLDVERVAANVASRSDAQAVEEVLGNWLHEHASYAVFLARPHLKRAQEAAKLLEPIAPPGDGAPKQGPAR